MSIQKPPLIAIVGPNASGKTSLSIKLAKKFNGEIISADSRQVYKGMDIGTGKATKQEQGMVKHHLLDITSPQREYNVSHFKRDALKAIKKIQKKGKFPFLVGGTGFWIQAIVDNIDFPNVKPNKKLRRQLGKKSTVQLLKLLKKLDPKRAKIIDNKNSYRLIRAVEIVKATKKAIPKLKTSSPFKTLILGVTHPRKKLYQHINNRLKIRFKQGMIAEVNKLHQQGVSWKRLYNFGLEYRYISLFLQNKLNRKAMEEQLKNAINHYAKRQMTWFGRDKRIHWVTNLNQAKRVINKFLKK
jgi:tRNA dimethylallyltransferase